MQAKEESAPISLSPAQAQAYHVDFALHTLGWKAFQDLCEQVLREELKCTVAVYREAQDGGQDAVFQLSHANASEFVGTAQCKFSSKRDQRLFAFLNRRLPIAVLKTVLERDPSIAGRKGERPPWYQFARSEEVLLRASAHKLSLLSEGVRSDTVYTLTDGGTYSLDMSFLRSDDILALFKPRELMSLAGQVSAILHTEFSKKIAKCAEDADPDGDIDDQFNTLSEFLYDTSPLTEDSFFGDKHSELTEELKRAKESVEVRKSDDDDDESFFNSVPRASKVEKHGGRSVFSDVAE